ncbi:MAG: zinc ABC transporter substrate-binding protein [Alphaproteobacteria bacterium]|nr:zinc ABC transporter substrate-binding protein [Alphaproteobacteria bacterium]
MRTFILAAAALIVSLSGPAGAEVQVVASIVPVHSLVAVVMDGAGKPHLLVPGKASPHTFAMRPSDARRLEQAQAVFWIGPMLESFLDRPLEALARDAQVVALAGAEGVRTLPFREGGPWEAHAHGGEAGTHGSHDHAHEVIDGHIWLDPRNAAAMTKAIARVLGQLDPANKGRYEANAARAVARIETLDKQIADTLSPVKGKPYIVFHDAYQYFEARYGLTPAGSITVSPEISPGAKRLVEIRARVAQDRAICVFSEPQFEPRLIATLIQGTQAKTAALDPEGALVEPGPGAYFDLMRNLGDDLTRCLIGQK